MRATIYANVIVRASACARLWTDIFRWHVALSFTASQQSLLFAFGFFFFVRCHCRRVWSRAKCVAQFVFFFFHILFISFSLSSIACFFSSFHYLPATIQLAVIFGQWIGIFVCLAGAFVSIHFLHRHTYLFIFACISNRILIIIITNRCDENN